MVFLRATLAVILALGSAPGVVEIVEDGAHLLLEGHTDHVDAQAPCPEHGCTPTSHHCGCCKTQQVADVGVAVAVPESPTDVQRWASEEAGPAPSGVARRLRRPPIV